MGVLRIDPHWRAHLEAQGLDSFPAFFNYPEGQIVGGHHTRNVALVELGGVRAYLKRQYRIAWKEYLESWWAGFGWVSKSGREWRALHSVRQRGIDCPRPLAYGEDRGRAFLLVRELRDAVDVGSHLGEQRGTAWPSAVRQRRKMIRAVARACARLHEQGFAQPDLYAKHVYVRPTDLGVSFIDLQRTSEPAAKTWNERWHDLAALDASVDDGLVSPRDRLAFLLAYLRSAGPRSLRRVFRQAVTAIERRSNHLLRRPRIRDMRQRYGSMYRVESYRVTLLDDRAAPPESEFTIPGRL